MYAREYREMLLSRYSIIMYYICKKRVTVIALQELQLSNLLRF